MKEIIAVIRPNKWHATKARLLREGIGGYTVQRVFGRGRQKGLLYLSGQVGSGIAYLPKRMVTLLVPDEQVREVVDLLVETNFTGEIGDGRIFVCPVDGSERIRTGETGEFRVGGVVI